jgi:hypothetical protein
MVEHVELLVEDRSMAEALRQLLPRLLGRLTWAIHEHQSKRDLLRRLPDRLRGYASWIPPTWRIVVLVDRDHDDCAELKADLERIAGNAGLVTRTAAAGRPYVVVNRLAIEELEAWYFGDWQAVRAAYPKVSPNVPSRARYRDPDAIKGGTWEAFERELQKAGYFKAGLRKVEAARAVGPQMRPRRNTSHSFQVLRSALVELAA